VEFVEEYKKFDMLMRILTSISRIKSSKVVVFAETKRGCESLYAQLRAKQWPAEAIHGDKSQREREHILSAFKQGTCRILIATDVASRGLDVKDISHVVNYDFPRQVEDYVHRIGRTARGGAEGTSISFFTDKNRRQAAELVRVMRETKQEIPERLREMAGGEGGERRGRSRSRSPKRGCY
jgi:ATP-dependent RNA helicase DDX5/DBP2